VETKIEAFEALDQRLNYLTKVELDYDLLELKMVKIF